MISFLPLHPRVTADHLGLIPLFIDPNDSRTAAEQFQERYRFGGWSPMKGWKHLGNYVLQYPEDPLIRPIAKAQLRDETIVMYEHAFVAIFQPDGSFEVSRMD